MVATLAEGVVPWLGAMSWCDAIAGCGAMVVGCHVVVPFVGAMVGCYCLVR